MNDGNKRDEMTMVKMWKSHTFGILTKKGEEIVQTYVVESEGQILKKFPNILQLLVSRRIRRSLFFTSGKLWSISRADLRRILRMFRINVNSEVDLCSARRSHAVILTILECFHHLRHSSRTFLIAKILISLSLSTFYSPRDRPKRTAATPEMRKTSPSPNWLQLQWASESEKLWLI